MLAEGMPHMRANALRNALVACSLVAAANVSPAGDLNPPPGPIAPTNRVQLNSQTTTLPLSITQPGSYVLTSDLEGVAGQNGIQIVSGDVTLDLNGFTLRGVAGSNIGLSISVVPIGIRVLNGNITGWGTHGIESGGGTVTMSGLNVYNNAGSCIRVIGDNNRIDSNHVSFCNVGIEVTGSDNLIVRNSATSNGTDYSIGAGNAYGPIVNVSGVGDITAVPNADHSWANFAMTCVAQTWCRDADGDGFGDAGDSVNACTAPAGYIADCTDCNDTNGAISPDGVELCDGLDNDCDGGTADGANDPSLGTPCDGGDSDACEEGVFICSAGTLTCNDSTGDNVEVCDGVDNDCDGVIDGASTCEENQTCSGGTCACDFPFADCDSDPENGCEIDTNNDDANCGGCGVVCPSGSTCSGGACTCGSGLTLCGGTCVDTSSDTSHCGGCGNVCPTGAFCSSGFCLCPSGQTVCAGACVDTDSDEANCGGCGVVCGSGLTCCSAACVNTNTDPFNCGACSLSCNLATEQCQFASCCLQDGESCSVDADCCSGSCSEFLNQCN